VRITINQAAVDQHYAARGIHRLSGIAGDREPPSVAHLAALVLRLDAPLAEIASVIDDSAASPSDSVRGQGVVRLAFVRRRSTAEQHVIACRRDPQAVADRVLLRV
jgi:hypothetical protein